MINYYYSIKENGMINQTTCLPAQVVWEPPSGYLTIVRSTPIPKLEDNWFYYYDFKAEDFVAVEKIPGLVFNYDSKSWQDTRSLTLVKEEKWGEIKQKRLELEVQGFMFNGMHFDSSRDSQNALLMAAMSGNSVNWTLSNNAVVSLTPEDLQGVVKALQEFINQLHERSQIARLAIAMATTREAVASIKF